MKNEDELKRSVSVCYYTGGVSVNSFTDISVIVNRNPALRASSTVPDWVRNNKGIVSVSVYFHRATLDNSVSVHRLNEEGLFRDNSK